MDWTSQLRLSQGSPPRVREKLLGPFITSFLAGITPACAGKTLAILSQRTVGWDHPRVCGKNDFDIEAFEMELGSPPRVREKLVVEIKSHLALGITPACAGKT